MKKELNYEDAYNELTEIVNEIENEKTSLDVLSDKTKRAVELINFCRTKLRSIEEVVGNNLDIPKN